MKFKIDGDYFIFLIPNYDRRIRFFSGYDTSLIFIQERNLGYMLKIVGGTYDPIK